MRIDWMRNGLIGLSALLFSQMAAAQWGGESPVEIDQARMTSMAPTMQGRRHRGLAR